MFKHILVPLDGSEPAEAALPAAKFLGRALKAVVTLVHIIEEDAPSTVHGELHLTSPQDAEAYLKQVSGRLASPEVKVVWHVHDAATTNVAQAMAAHEDELGPDLIAMSTHGPSGLRRIMAGSMAQRIVAAGYIPVLLVRPDGPHGSGAFEIRSILAPLDGEDAHERGLEVAVEMARAIGTPLRLLSVVPTLGNLAGRDATMGRFMPGTTQAILDFAEEDLRSYLTGQSDKIQRAGVMSSVELCHGDIAEAISEAADAMDCSMIVLATHGRAGTEAFWNNSVAARVLAQTKRPLLLVPAHHRDSKQQYGTAVPASSPRR